MAGAGGTSPQQPNQMDDLREQLIQAITDHLHGGNPQAPQYQPAQVTPQQGFAMARNPQLAPMLNQNIQAPAQAQFQQQQAAFEAAMQRRHQALQAGTSLVNAQQRQDPLDALRLQETIRHNKEMEKPNLTAPAKPREMLTTHPDGTQWIFNLDTNQERRAGGAAKPPSEATVTARTSFETTKENLSLLKNMAMAGGSGGLLGRAGATVQRGLSHIPGNEMFSSQANVNDYNAIVNDLGTQLRTVYGAQGIRSIQEIQLLLKNLPPYGSAPELIEQRFAKIDAIINKLESERQRMQPAAFPTTPQQPADPLLEELWGGQ